MYKCQTSRGRKIWQPVAQVPPPTAVRILSMIFYTVASKRGTDGTKPSKPLESTAGPLSVGLVSFNVRGFWDRNEENPQTEQRGLRYFLGELYVLGEVIPAQAGIQVFPVHVGLGKLPQGYRTSPALPLRKERHAQNGLFNQTKPIFVENKGSIEEQTQTKPKNEPSFIRN
jgi:hypothetical protein